MRLINEKRCFIIFYICESQIGKANGNYTTEGLLFPKRKNCIKYICESNNMIFEEPNVVITNIIEVSKEDLDEWNS